MSDLVRNQRLPCEWNPVENRPAYDDDKAHADATVVVGKSKSWHLCTSCAALPEFKRFRLRRPLNYGGAA